MSVQVAAVPAWRLMPWVAALVLLIAPAVAMRLTNEIQWGGADFALFAAMLVAVCGAFELSVRLSGRWSYRAASLIATTAAAMMVWANLAVGIVGSEDNQGNLAFFAVLAVGTAGALLARFRAAGMARTMLAMAAAQLLAALVEPRGMVLVFTAVYLSIWLSAAFLFGRAARA